MTTCERKIVVIIGHPLSDSLCAALARAYVDGATAAGAAVRLHLLSELAFDPLLHRGYREIQELEPDLRRVQQDILWANHLVFAFPIWWGVPPALLKGFFDRVVVPGFGYKYKTRKSLFQDKLLRGRSARLLCTLDSPPWYYRWLVGAPGVKMLRRSILGFCGVAPVRASLFGSVKLSSPARRQGWLATAERLGRQGQ